MTLDKMKWQTGHAFQEKAYKKDKDGYYIQGLYCTARHDGNSWNIHVHNVAHPEDGLRQSKVKAIRNAFLGLFSKAQFEWHGANGILTNVTNDEFVKHSASLGIPQKA